MAPAKHHAVSRDPTFDMMFMIFPTAPKKSKEPLPVQKPFPFLMLPPELRGMIYEPLIQAGHLSVLRVSKLLNQETVPYLSKVASLRLNLGNSVYSQARDKVQKQILALRVEVTLSDHLTLIAPGYIQNLELRLNMVEENQADYNIDQRFIECFRGNTIPRKSCKITVKFGALGPIRGPMKWNEAYLAIATLTGFEILTLRLEFVGDARHEATMLRNHGLEPRLHFHGLSREKLRMYYRTVHDFLAVTLGPAEYCIFTAEHCLKFQPSVHQISGQS